MGIVRSVSQRLTRLSSFLLGNVREGGIASWVTAGMPREVDLPDRVPCKYEGPKNCTDGGPHQVANAVWRLTLSDTDTGYESARDEIEPAGRHRFALLDCSSRSSASGDTSNGAFFML